jgi:hypothetical protein
MQNTTEPETNKAGKRWDEQDEQVLVENYLKGLSADDLGSLLGRKASAVRARLVKICFPDFVSNATGLAGNAGSEWSTDEDTKLVLIYESSGDLEKLAELLGRKPHELLYRLVDLVIAKPVKSAVVPKKSKDSPKASGGQGFRSMPKSWSKAERDQLRELFQAGKAIDAMARELDRSTPAVIVQLINSGMVDEGDLHIAISRAQSRANWSPNQEGKPF